MGTVRMRRKNELTAENSYLQGRSSSPVGSSTRRYPDSLGVCACHSGLVAPG
jgi:hypothetical protein